MGKIKFAENLKALRAISKLTQKELADRIDMSRDTVIAWESGKTTPTLYQIEAIATALGVYPGILIGMDNNQLESTKDYLREIGPGDGYEVTLDDVLDAQDSGGETDDPSPPTASVNASPYVPNDGTKGRVRNPDDMLAGDHKGLMKWLRERGVKASDDIVYFPILSPELTACCGVGIPVFDITNESTELMPFERSVAGAIDDLNPPYVVHSDGTSMVGYGIAQGALCLINPVEKVNVGDIALVKFGDKSMIKKVYWRKDGAELRSSDGDNFTVSTEEFESGWVQVVGRLMATTVRY